MAKYRINENVGGAQTYTERDIEADYYSFGDGYFTFYEVNGARNERRVQVLALRAEHVYAIEQIEG